MALLLVGDKQNAEKKVNNKLRRADTCWNPKRHILVLYRFLNKRTPLLKGQTPNGIQLGEVPLYILTSFT